MLTSWLKPFLRTGKVVCRGGDAPQWVMRPRPGHREFHGLFALFDGLGQPLVRMPGRVVEWPGLPVEVYIYDPPAQLRAHRHGRCLQLLEPGGRWFKLHWERPARTFDQARAYVEQLLAESIPGGG